MSSHATDLMSMQNVLPVHRCLFYLTVKRHHRDTDKFKVLRDRRRSGERDSGVKCKIVSLPMCVAVHSNNKILWRCDCERDELQLVA